ncbi:Potassium/sodium hyperpolarization-activated cyclic nucleotide-gated channel 4 [Borealophlyctis nickersoniae]|nr:Potassium/sodium hyperpolarization-activated cyclic nucleotide-gated channel 4 [Borealophlyctis nickersoniae]
MPIESAKIFEPTSPPPPTSYIFQGTGQQYMDDPIARLLNRLKSLEDAITKQETAFAGMRQQMGELILDCRTLADGWTGPAGKGYPNHPSIAQPVTPAAHGITLPPIEPIRTERGQVDNTERIHQPSASNEHGNDEESGQVARTSVVQQGGYIFPSPVKPSEVGGAEHPLAKAKIRAAMAAAAAMQRVKENPDTQPGLITVGRPNRWYHRFYRDYFAREQRFSFAGHSGRNVTSSLLTLNRKTYYRFTFMTHPNAAFSQLWNAIHALALAVAFVGIPACIGFSEASEWTGYVSDDGQVIMDPDLVRKRYLRSFWFYFDLITMIPWVFIVDAAVGTDDLTLLTQWRAVCLINVARAVKLFYMERHSWFDDIGRFLRVKYGIHSAGVDSIVVFGSMVLYWHWYACIDNWIHELDHDHILDDMAGWDRYTLGFYSSASEMFTAGFGAKPPATTTKRWLTVLNIIFSAAFEAVLVGHVSTFLISLDTSGRMFKEKLDEVNQYIAYKGLDANLKRRVLNYYEFKYSSGKYFNEESILTELNNPLRQQISLHNCRSLILKVPFFRDGDNAFINSVVTILEINHYLSGDVVIEEATSGEEMYFIATGICEVLTEGIVRARLTPGLFFGEISLLFGKMKRTATIRCATACVLYSLSKTNLDIVLEHHPLMAHRIRKVAEDRLAQLKAMKKMDAAAKKMAQDRQADANEGLPNVYDEGEKALTPVGSVESLPALRRS